MKSKSSNKVETNESVKFPTEVLLKSKALAGYQKDFARVILTESCYTLEDAITLLDKKLKEEA